MHRPLRTGTFSSFSPVQLAVRQSFALLPISFSLAMLTALLLESWLSFLGLGVLLPDISLGVMARNLWTHPALVAPPLGIIFIAAGALLAIAIPYSRIQTATVKRT